MSGGDKLDFEIRPNPAPVSAAERAALLANPGFGRVFTDHMVTIRYADGKGWYDARVEARAPIPMDPATAVLHYAQEIFEGLKAYRTPDGGVDDVPAGRQRRAGSAPSAQRMAMPPLPEELFLDSLRRAHRDRPGVDPDRPRRAASTCGRSCSPARSSSACARRREYLYVVIASPVGSYFAGGVKPVTVWVSPDYTRAAPGGTGAAKCGGNYAASASPPRPRRSSTAATRWSSSTRWSAGTSTSSAA